MNTFRANSEDICVGRHFNGKDRKIKKITGGTLARMIDLTKQWLSLSSSCREFTSHSSLMMIQMG